MRSAPPLIERIINMPVPHPPTSALVEGLLRRSASTTPEQRRAMLIGAVVGLFVGGSMGIAAFGSATNGAVPGAVVGALLGFAVTSSEVNF